VATSTLAVPLRPEEDPATQRARQPALRVDVTLSWRFGHLVETPGVSPCLARAGATLTCAAYHRLRAQTAGDTAHRGDPPHRLATGLIGATALFFRSFATRPELKRTAADDKNALALQSSYEVRASSMKASFSSWILD
jgi:hypothetical protein